MQKKSGFSLIELMIVVSLLSILAAFGAPYLQGFLSRQEQRGTLALLETVIQTARQEALLRNTNLSLCASQDGHRCSGSREWTRGYIVFVNPDLSLQPQSGSVLEKSKGLRYGRLYFNAFHAHLNIDPQGKTIEYGQFNYCPKNNAIPPEGLVINDAARPRLTIRDPREGEVDRIVCP